MRTSRRFSRSTIVAAMILTAWPVCAQDIGSAAQGLVLAQRVCSECHAIGPSQTRSPNAAAPRFETIANVPGMTELALTVALRTPHRTMPNIILEASELRNIAAYILSLQRSN
jgi:mono/diheme cytochrome c family protein